MGGPCEYQMSFGGPRSDKVNARFIATEEGIFEYKINAVERGRFPGISWR